MITVRRSAERGQVNLGWLKSAHTFSFGEYHDPSFMGFRSLRVINDDVILPGKGFGTHPHADMEILTYVVSGALAHKDSMGNGRIISAGELQSMSAGRGITHSEFNASTTDPVHLLQIWIHPEQRSLTPSYSEWKPQANSSHGQLQVLASPTRLEGSALIHQDARLLLGQTSEGTSMKVTLSSNRHAWIQMIAGELHLLGQTLLPGDGAAISGEEALSLESRKLSHYLFFDLA